MPAIGDLTPLPDESARRRALLEHEATLLVEAGAGSGKTALMAGRIALMLAAGIQPRSIVAITFTEAAASELLDRIERFVAELHLGKIAIELRVALPNGLSPQQSSSIEAAAKSLDEITCTTIHGFCQQLIKPYPVEAHLDPGAVIIDPAAATLAYQDLIKQWLSVRFGRTPSENAELTSSISAIESGTDFFSEMLVGDPDQVIRLINEAAEFLRTKRTAAATVVAFDCEIVRSLAEAIDDFNSWYVNCGVIEPVTGATIGDLQRFRDFLRTTTAPNPTTARAFIQLLLHEPPECCHGKEPRFNKWGHKGKWQNACKDAGHPKSRGDQFSSDGQVRYDACSAAYRQFVEHISAVIAGQFLAEFDVLRSMYASYKRKAALLDFDDLLYHARNLLATNNTVRRSLSQRYPRILVDEFQDTDPLQAEILWLLCGEANGETTWIERALRPGSLFLVGDPKQAIYRFRNADVATYLKAKAAIQSQAADSVLEITSNFRSSAPILDFVNDRFSPALAESENQPGFTALAATRPADPLRPSVACYEIAIGDQHKNARGALVADLVRREEAAAVANVVASLIAGYSLWDKHQKAYRPCRPGDIALLAPTGTSLWIYERALDRHEIPVASQAGKGFFRRQEVQELIALTRAIANGHDTLALGAVLRGPLVGLTEEEIADAIAALPVSENGGPSRLNLWTDRALITNVALARVLEVLQSIARKARRNTPYQLIAEAVEELNVRPILRARYRLGSERALANAEMFLEMSRPFDGRGLRAFADAMRRNWEDAEAQVEGRPDAKDEAVSIVTIHSSKGLEWPIVIPINSPTELSEESGFLHRRSDDTVHFKPLGRPTAEYDQVKADEDDEVRRERVRLWYVATTRACDLLLLPRQSERNSKDWMSLLDLRLSELPSFETPAATSDGRGHREASLNRQDLDTWRTEAGVVASFRRSVTWHSPSRHEAPSDASLTPALPLIYSDVEQLAFDIPPLEESDVGSTVIQGGRQRGLLVHKLLEEVLTGELADTPRAISERAKELMVQLGVVEAATPEHGPTSVELAATVERAFRIPEINTLRANLQPEMTVFDAQIETSQTTYVAGIVDALVRNETGKITVVVDWKTDVAPTPTQVDLYRRQVRDYLKAAGASEGLIVFVTSGNVVTVNG